MLGGRAQRIYPTKREASKNLERQTPAGSARLGEFWRTLGGNLEGIFDVFFGKTRTPVEAPKEPETVAPLPRSS